MRMRGFARLSCSVAFAAMLFARAVSADPSPEDKALSTELFKQGRALLEQGKIAEACEKLAESERLVPAAGTLLNLALCNEKLGKTATAYAAFVEARARAQHDGRADRVKTADAHIAALEPKLSRLTITVPANVDLPALRVFRDGSEVGRAAWGTAMPVDPGEHTVEARADGYKSWTRTARIGQNADAQTMTLEALEPDAPPVTEPPPQPPLAAPKPVAPLPPQPLPAPATATAPAVHAETGDGQRTLAYVLGGVGVVGVGVGSYFGLRARSKWSDSDEGCPRDDQCTAAGAEAARDARTAADVSTLSFALGGAALGVGAWLFFTAEPADRKSAAVWIRPGVGPHALATSFGARF